MRGGGARWTAAALVGAILVAASPVLAATGAGAPGLTTVAGTGSPGSSGPGARPAGARLDRPAGIALDAAGDLFIADTGNCRVEEIPARTGTHYGLAMTAHRIYAVAGTACAGPHGLGFPTGVAVDRAGDLFIAEASGERVLEVAAAGGGRALPAKARAALVRGVAGTGSPGSNGLGGPATAAQLDGPTGIAVDPTGDLFIADTEACRVDEVPMAAGSHYGVAMLARHLYSVAGTGTCGMAGLGGPAASAQLWNPTAVTLDGTGDLFVADRGAGMIVELAVAAGTYYGTAIGAGDLATVTGVGVSTPYLADGFSATGVAAEVNDPEGLALAADGDLYIADTSERVVRVVPAEGGTLFGRSMIGGDLYTVVGAMPTGTGLNSNRWVTARVTTPYGLALDPAGDLYFSDQGANQVRVLRP